jgi:TonB-dependent SusC/RagA subfamily outer membrane receptor
MTTSLLRIAFSACVLIGLTAGCASTHPRDASGRPIEPPKENRETGEPIEKRLQAQEPGLLVTRTADGGIAVQIRGTSSFYGSNQPLYVVDDVPISPGPGGALAGVNPHDIESIKVLKNPSDIGIYGMRGANGVIVIKTKKPGRG